MTNSDLCQRIVAFADSRDLLVLEVLSRQWQIVVRNQFRVMRNGQEFKYISFKEHDLYDSDKRMCCRISNQRTRGSSRVCVVGGSFGSLYTNNCMIEDRTDKLQGRLHPRLDIPIKLGSTASTYDSSGNILMIGGWDDLDEVILDTVYHLDVHSPSRWIKQDPINHPRCFGAAERTIQGDVLFFAGGSSPYRGADCYTDCYIRKRHTTKWTENIVPSLQHARCGHSAVTLFNGSILVTGGYAGGFDYLSSVELLDASLDRWTSLPAMSVPRSGMAAVLGPGGEVYVAGGSPDGTLGHKSVERYDPREGKWQALESMHLGRGYTAGCVSTWESFFVSGGTHNMKFQGGMECYDFRSGHWRLLKEAGSAETTDVGAADQLDWQLMLDNLQDFASDNDESSGEEDNNSDTEDSVSDGDAGSVNSGDGEGDVAIHEESEDASEEESGEEFEEISMSGDQNDSVSSSDHHGSGSAQYWHQEDEVPLLDSDSSSDSSSTSSQSHVSGGAGAVPNDVNDLKDVHLLRGCHQMLFIL